MNEIFPILKANDLVLRQIIASDISSIYRGLSHPDVIKYYGVNYTSLSGTKEQMLWFKELEENNTGIWWAITGLSDQVFYGAIGFNNLNKTHKKVEIGFWLLPEYWGKGIMKNAITIACNYGFDVMKIHRIEALVESENINSKTILNKSNFNHEGTLVDFEIKNGNFISLDSYAKFY